MRSMPKIGWYSRNLRNAGISLALLLSGVTAAAYSYRAHSGRQTNPGGIVTATGQARINESIGKLPLAFEPNRGQTDPHVQYVARAKGYTAFLTGDAAVLRMKGAAEGVLQMSLRDGETGRLEASAPQPGKSNYFIGNDRSKWLTEVPHYGQVAYRDVYRGIDVVYSGNQTDLEYDFVVRPGADPSRIHVAYNGASRMALNAHGDLELDTPAGRTVAHKPVVYQNIAGHRQPVRGDYVLTARNEVAFRVGSYDRREPLIIDPTVTVLTYVGGTGNDTANAVTANAQGVFFTGSTASTNFPLTPPTCGAGLTAAPCVSGAPVLPNFPSFGNYSGGRNTAAASDAYVTKLSADGTTLLWSTYLGGTLSQAGNGIAVDATGLVYVTGVTTSSDFPVTNFSVITGTQDAFITKLDSLGLSLIYSGYFGADLSTTATAVAVDGSGNAFMVGYTNSTMFVPTQALTVAATPCASGNVSNCSSAFSGTALRGPQDGLIVKFRSDGTPVFSSLIGATGVTTAVNAVAVDSAGAVYIAGTANGNTGGINAATRFPTTQSGATGTGTASNLIASAAGPNLAFATKITLDANNSPTVAWSDTIGSGSETGAGIAVDSTGRAYVAGSTVTGFGVSGTQLSGGPVVDPLANAGYVVSLAADGKTANYADFLAAPGATSTQLNAIALDDAGQAYVTGVANFATPAKSIYVARLNPAGSFIVPPVPGSANFAGAIQNGAGVNDTGNGIAVMVGGGLRSAFVVGNTNAAAGAAPPSTTAYLGSLIATNLRNFLSWGTNALALTTPQLPPGGTAPGGGDAIFAALTFRDFVASSTNLTFTSTGVPGTAGTDQSQMITVTGIGGTALPCSIGVVPNSATGSFFTNANAGSPTISGSTITVDTGTQTIPALGSPVAGSFQIQGATGCPFFEPLTIGVTYSSATAITATVGYTVGSNPPVTGLSSLSFNIGSGQTANVPSSATLTVNAPSGVMVPIVVSLSQAPAGLACGGNGPITAGAVTPSPLVGGTPSTSTLTINTACLATAAPGTYLGAITVSSSTNAVAPVVIPYTFTINPGLNISGPLNFQFSTNTQQAQQQSATITSSAAGAPFTYAATYTPAATNGLPAANVTIVTGSSGSIPSGISVPFPVQVNPAGLSNGPHSGTITISPTGSSSFAPLTLTVTAVVGNPLVVTSPTGALNIVLPTGLTSAPVPGTVLPNGIVLTNLSASTMTITNATGVTSAFSGLSTSPLTVADGSTPCTGVASGSSCNYAVSVTTNNLPAGTYTGRITFLSSTPNGANTLTALLTVNLTVTSSKPTFIVTAGTTGTAATTLLTSPVTLTAITNGLRVCSNGAPGLALNGGTIGSITYTATTTAALNPFSVTGPPAGNISSTPTALSICADPQVLGSQASGLYQGSVTVSSGDTQASVVIPVTLILNSAPGNTDLSNIGVFRGFANGLAEFALNTDQVTYNFIPGSTRTTFFGLAGDQAVAGDWTGTGVVRIGVFRAGAWYLDLNNNGLFDANEGPFYFGLPGDVAVVGDWNGTGVTKFGVFRCPAAGVCQWYLSTAVTQANATILLVPFGNIYTPGTTQAFSYGLPGDQPVVNNWTGTSRADQIGVFRCPGVGVCSWIVDSNGDGVFQVTDAVYSYGLIGDIPVVGDWNDNGQRKRIGVFRNGTWILDTNGNNTFDVFDLQASFGLSGDLPVVGKWTIQ